MQLRLRRNRLFVLVCTRCALIVAFAVMLFSLFALPLRAAPFATTVMDARTGEILHAVNDTTRLHPASLTKMMTLYVVFEAIRNGEISLDTEVRISRRAAREPPSRLGLREGQRIAVRHLIRAAALRSANDAATALAEAVSGSVEAFVARMNRTAQAIGMTQTTFRNAHGLTAPGHLSTARDMTILGRQLYFDFPQYYGLFSRRSDNAGIANVANTNARFLDSYPGADGIKTGYTAAAGYNLTAMAERNGVRIIVTVFGARSVQDRHEKVIALMDRGFRMAPARARVHRPPPPDYSRADRVAAASSGASGGERPAAGRVVRLQPAPSRSPFPMRRPNRTAPLAEPPPIPSEAPNEALMAAVEQGLVEAMRAGLADQAAPQRGALPATVPAPAAGDPESAARQGGVQAAPETDPPEETALALALRPPRRPEITDPERTEMPATAEELAAEIGAARKAGASIIEPELYAALPQASQASGAPEGFVDDAGEAAALAAASAEEAPALAAAPEEAPAGLGTETLAVPEGLATVAAVPIVDGVLAIPGLPPFVLPPRGQASSRTEGAAPGYGSDAVDLALAGDTAAADAAFALEPSPPEPALAEPLFPTRSAPTVILTPEGGMIWQDDQQIAAFEDPKPEIGPLAMILTRSEASRDSVAEPPPSRANSALTEIVIRARNEDAVAWAIDLGLYGSRFDAERTLLRAALSEAQTLAAGERRVEAEQGRHRALIANLSEEQAMRACLRLQAMAQSCTVLQPR